jgi:hypothetical protein
MGASKRLRVRTQTSRRKNLHHLAWPRTQYNGIRKEARLLPCLQVMLDIEVHRVLHDMYNFPKLMKVEDAKLLVERHKARVCACFDRNGVQVVNILAINRREDEDDDEAPREL